MALASRPAWKGFLRLSLVTVPVQAHSAMATSHGQVQLNQLHETCHNRIKYTKTCPVHGEVPPDEIVMGYKYDREHYVEITDAEKEQAHSKSDKSVGIEKLVPMESIDPLYYQGKNYYLLPDGPHAKRSYAVLYQAMLDSGRCAVAQVALSGRDQVVAIHPKDGLLVMSALTFQSQLKDEGQFRSEAQTAEPTDEEMKLARMLLETTYEDDPHLEQYEDTYTDKLREVIEAKVEGHKVIAPPTEEAPPVINLLDAIRRSLDKAPPTKKKMAPSEPKRSAKRKKKSS